MADHRLYNFFLIVKASSSMRRLFFVIALSATSCHKYDKSEVRLKEYNERTTERSYVIYINHDECTECLDGYILKGIVGVPNNLKIHLGDTLKTKDIVLAGNFPFEKIDNTSSFFRQDACFKIKGKIIGVDSSNGIGKAPVFYVEEWENTGRQIGSRPPEF